MTDECKDDIEYVDDDGYPTDAALKLVREWDVKDVKEFHDLMLMVKYLWRWANYVIRNNEQYTLITGGWSGNESIVAAMKENLLLHIMYWYSSNRSGTHIYAPHGWEVKE